MIANFDFDEIVSPNELENAKIGKKFNHYRYFEKVRI